MFNIFIICFGKLIIFISRFLNLGDGSTWPGHIALNVNKNFIKDIFKKSRIEVILIAGTNGKTTTGKLTQTILEGNGKRVFQNASGANLLNGIASSLVTYSNFYGTINKDFAIFEIDENTLPLILKEIPNPDYLIVLNLFRDQLDRYGEVNTIAKKWKKAIKDLDKTTTLILNADDPQVTFLGDKSKAKLMYFGLDEKNKNLKSQHASDSTYCPKCQTKLNYSSIYFSHLGNWNCVKCGYSHPKKTLTSFSFYPLLGTYNQYNANATVLLAKDLGLSDEKIKNTLKDFKPAFGRQETLTLNHKNVQIFLSKNPTGLNESLKTVASEGAQNILLLLNDRIPDGLDVSWIWDVDFEDFATVFRNITVGGDRTFDMGLRLKYAEYKNFALEENLSKAIEIALDKAGKGETLYVLPTYSAMLEVRKILTGKKIL